jgi:hypothetical protein
MYPAIQYAAFAVSGLVAAAALCAIGINIAGVVGKPGPKWLDLCEKAEAVNVSLCHFILAFFKIFSLNTRAK